MNLQEIKNRVENQMIFLEGHTEDIHFENEVHWLIEQAEKVKRLEDLYYKYLTKSNELESKIVKIRDIVNL